MSFKNISQSSCVRQEQPCQDQFYKLHYKPRRNSELHTRDLATAFRSKSIMEAARESEEERARKHKQRQMYFQARKEEERRLQGLGRQRKRSQKFSLKRMLSVDAQKGSLQNYFRNHKARGKIDIGEWTKKSLTVRLAAQRCEDEKIKVQKVMNSSKQSEETKMDYLSLKKRELQRQVHQQITAIYDEFFKKQYQEAMGYEGRNEFQDKLRVVMGLIRGG